jgi:hypothetical protein
MSLPTTFKGSRWQVLDDCLESGCGWFLKYRKWFLVGLCVCIATIIAGSVMLAGIHENSNLRRDAAYHATLQSYQGNLKTGFTRKEVANFLRTRNTPFFEGQDGDLLAMVGEEKLPWYVWWCGGETIYVEFQFVAPTKGGRMTGTNDMDELEAIFLSKRAEGCL